MGKGVNMKHSYKFRTICEVLREINDIIQEDNDNNTKIRTLLEEATLMGKKMAGKLFEYSQDRFPDYWKHNPKIARRIKSQLRSKPNYKPLDISKIKEKNEEKQI